MIPRVLFLLATGPLDLIRLKYLKLNMMPVLEDPDRNDGNKLCTRQHFMEIGAMDSSDQQDPPIYIMHADRHPRVVANSIPAVFQTELSIRFRTIVSLS